MVTYLDDNSLGQFILIVGGAAYSKLAMLPKQAYFVRAI